ncbi:GntR family transcriptional regulator of arabinose operon [Geomicrobium halophilum]|uniref:GntR family transcriptional regulator of arabinose operon n=1 Tax=Geomicrobium halophilum TaxID=549000 RepID=A0A841PQA8_9BACL|nr:GntR family transcriptional regulator [Geomicrobium halophilum]MBB6450929.1 GntR family transcriptional regulator of arabinose operon [Geomicrobium halophilum]
MTAKYKQIKQHIKSKILDGSFQPHQKLNSEYEFVEEFQVSRHTIRQAIGELVSEGWLYRNHGVGTFCADRSNMVNNPSRKNIAIITTYISDYIFPHLIRGAESYLSDKGYNVMIFSTNNEFEKEKLALENILTQQVDGVIIEPTKSAFSNPNLSYYLNLENSNIPYVMFHAYYEELDPFSLTLNDEAAGFLITEHLIRRGHKNIIGAFKNDDTQGIQRMKGFFKAHRKHNCRIDPSLLITYSTLEKNDKSVREVGKLLKRNDNKPTGIVAYNDELVIKLLKVLRSHQLSVPDDISILGIDDSHFTEATEIKFSSAKHPKEKLGQDAAKMIVDLIEGRDREVDSIVYEPELVLRNSSKDLTAATTTTI